MRQPRLMNIGLDPMGVVFPQGGHQVCLQGGHLDPLEWVSRVSCSNRGKMAQINLTHSTHFCKHNNYLHRSLPSKDCAVRTALVMAIRERMLGVHNDIFAIFVYFQKLKQRRGRNCPGKHSR